MEKVTTVGIDSDDDSRHRCDHRTGHCRHGRNAREFKNGRQFAAWIGLTLSQYSTGGKPRLGHISKRGDAYLRNLLVQGARSVLQSAAMHQDRMSRWSLELLPRRGLFGMRSNPNSHNAVVDIRS